MPAPIFLDTNVPIYAAGTSHPLKEPCAQILLLVAEYPERFVTDAEVLQELLHRYTSLGRWTQGRAVLEHFAILMDERIEPVVADDVRRAATLVDGHPRLSARDLIHLAIAQRVGATHMISADVGFDGIASLQRLDPLDLASWRADIMP